MWCSAGGIVTVGHAVWGFQPPVTGVGGFVGVASVDFGVVPEFTSESTVRAGEWGSAEVNYLALLTRLASLP
jgi:hypothetical protein